VRSRRERLAAAAREALGRRAAAPRRHPDGRDLASIALPGTRLPPASLHNASRLLYQQRLLAQVEGVDGDVVECGVGRGTTLLFWSVLSFLEGRDRNVWGFDSFRGFPPPTREDESPRRAYEGEWSGQSVESVYEVLLASGLAAEWVRAHVTLVPGFFEDTLERYTGDRIALLYIDADLYRSYRVVLDTLYPKVADGGIVALDEYMGTWEHYHFPGARRAVDEFLAERGAELRRDQRFGKYYLVKEGAPATSG
jgi:hypothetical protein